MSVTMILTATVTFLSGCVAKINTHKNFRRFVEAQAT
jgi:hypothetical protein